MFIKLFPLVFTSLFLPILTFKKKPKNEGQYRIEQLVHFGCSYCCIQMLNAYWLNLSTLLDFLVLAFGY
ncbi:hypothetical protein Mgra_00001370 [Meloidogyne graminicola]|uniref:Uncharacterized protein n=1 Tax=Meloidogyne graminicola TaxID=189291 RepID=A0A8T0A151_9BILA|nr:hypothetical protein Mgra_00001370 [Meloidogyne graminicola]